MLRLLLARYVASNFGCSHNRSITIVYRRNRQRDIQSSPIFGEANGFEVIDFLTATNLFEDKILLCLALGRNYHPDRLANHLSGAISKHPLRGQIPRGNDAFESFADDGVIARVDDRIQQKAIV